MKKWFQPATITALVAACVTLAKCWTDTAVARDKIEQARWERANGMAAYQQWYEDASADIRALEVTVLTATNLTELQDTVKGSQ